MFHHILVLLDGSQRAELALPVATRLVRATGSLLTFLRLVVLPADYVWYQLEPPRLAHTLVTTEKLNASTYLKSKAWEMDLAGISVQTSMLPGLPLDQIHTFIEDHAIDLVVMCSRGQISRRPQAQRSMARQVLRQSAVPVLILQETVGARGTLFPRDVCPVCLMVPLDGSALAEAALAPAAFLSAALSAPEQGRLHLVRVLPWFDNMETREPIRKLKERASDKALGYLQAMSQRLHTGDLEPLHLSVTTSVLLHPDVAQTLVRMAEVKQDEVKQDKANGIEAGERCDIIALTLHGRSGFRHERMGSIAEQVLQETRLPCLVVPPPPGEPRGGNVNATTLAGC